MSQRANGVIFLLAAVCSVAFVAWLAVSLSGPAMSPLDVLLAPELRGLVLPLLAVAMIGIVCGALLMRPRALHRRTSIVLAILGLLITAAVIPFLGIAASIIAAPTALLVAGNVSRKRPN